VVIFCMNDILKKINEYYTQKIEIFGNTPAGVDWNSLESQYSRFKELSKIIREEDFTILDYGCGYGALYNYLALQNKKFRYFGFDISVQMIEAATQNINIGNNFFFTSDKKALYPCDYVTASGIFNVKLDVPVKNWENYILNTLKEMGRLSIKGFSFNILSIFCDDAFKKNYLYYADPEWLIELCKKLFSDRVQILKDYSLYEFTILVYK
jgi:SAM-dependent methyltransferase